MQLLKLLQLTLTSQRGDRALRGCLEAIDELLVLGLRLQCAHIFTHNRGHAYSRILAASPRISRISAAGGRTGRRALAGLDGTSLALASVSPTDDMTSPGGSNRR